MVDLPDCLAPGLLVSMPHLLDPNFRKTVVLMTAHDPEDGAMGFIANRPLPATVQDVLEGLDIAWHGDAREPVWSGGPVLPRSGWVLFGDDGGRDLDETQEVLPGLYLTASLDHLRELAQAPPERFRLLLGHSGWSGGQLESELSQGAWLTLPAVADELFEGDPEEAWSAAFRKVGIDPGSIVMPSPGIQ